MKSENKTAIINIMSTIILQGIMFFTIPLFTRLLGSKQYGIYSVFNSWVVILTCFMGFGIHSSLGTGRYAFKNNYSEFRNCLLLFSTIICAIEILFIIIVKKKLAYVLGYAEELVVFLAISAASHYIITFIQTACIYEKKPIFNFVLSTTLSLLTVIVSLVLIRQSSSESKYLGRIYGTSLSYCFVAIIVWIIWYIKRPAGLKVTYCKYGLTVGFPIIFHTLAQNILVQSDRVMMQFLEISNSEIGIYSLFYSLSSVLSIALNALNISWCPFYYDDISEQKWDLLDKKCRNYIELFTVLAIGFLLLSREVAFIMADSSYWTGINIIPVLVFSTYFTFMYQFPVNFEFFHKKTGIIATGTIGASILNILLNMIMIPLWGMYGAATATALSYLILFLVHYTIVFKMSEGKYHLKIHIFVPALIALLVSVAIFYMLSSWWYIRWGLGLILGCFELYRINKRRSIF